MRLFRRKAEALNQDKGGNEGAAVLYEGRFLYAGGFPGAAQPGKKMSAPKVFVTEQGIEYREVVKRRHQTLFSIDRETIQSVRRNQEAPGWGDNPDQFVIVDISTNGRTFAVQFKAEGFTAQRDSFALYGAISALLATA